MIFCFLMSLLSGQKLLIIVEDVEGEALYKLYCKCLEVHECCGLLRHPGYRTEEKIV